MTTVRASAEIPGCPVSAAEELWYDSTRWPAFVDGLKHVHAIDAEYPHAGAVVKWESFPGGRGRVLEKVVGYEPRRGQQLDVRDTQIRGRQSVEFTATQDGGMRVELELDYEIVDRKLLTPIVDLLFVRRAQADSLRRTVLRFARELRAEPVG